MAVKNNKTAATTTTTNGSGSWEKATAYLNIALPSASKPGELIRVESVKLKASNVVHQQLINRLNDPEATPEQIAERIARFKELIVIDFVMARTEDEKEVIAF